MKSTIARVEGRMTQKDISSSTQFNHPLLNMNASKQRKHD
jgi:hypothetical protein